MATYDEDEDLDKLDRGDDFVGTDDDDEVLEDDVVEEEGDEDASDTEETEEDYDVEDEDEIDPFQERIDLLLRQQEEQARQNQWLQNQIEKLLQGKEPKVEEAPAFDYSAAEEEYANLLVTGELAKAAKIRVEIDNAKRTELLQLIKASNTETETKAKSHSSEALLERDFRQTIENFESQYDFLRQGTKAYNADAVETINTLMAGFLSVGKNKVEALTLAVKKAAPLYTTSTKTTKSLADTRKAEAGKKAVVAAKSQPARTKTVGVSSKDAAEVLVSKMSDKDFDKLTKAELKALRGDF